MRTRELHGEAVRWDGSNAAVLAALAGERFEGTYASSALVRNSEGELVHVRPGWVVTRWGGRDDVSISSAGAFEVWAEEAT